MKNLKHAGGMSYSNDSIEVAHEINIAMLASKNPEHAATARLLRDMINVMDRWLEAEIIGRTAPAVLLSAGAHALVSVAGNILLAAEPARRRQLCDELQAYVNRRFQALLMAVEREP